MRARIAAVGMLAWASLGSACSKESPPAAAEPKAPLSGPARTTAGAPEPETSPVALTTPVAAESPAALAVSRVKDENFELGLSPKGSLEAGKPATVEILLEAKGAFHVNDKYPYKFRLKEAPGLKFAAMVVGKDAAKLEHKQLSMPLTFTAESPGKYTVAGQFSFSVCTDDKCLIEKRDLALAVDVK